MLVDVAASLHLHFVPHHVQHVTQFTTIYSDHACFNRHIILTGTAVFSVRGDEAEITPIPWNVP